MQAQLDRLLAAPNGHFRLESGLHGDRWLELAALFLRPGDLHPLVRELAARLAQHDISAVCGPLIGGAFLAQAVAGELGLEFYYAERFAPPTTDRLYAVEYRLPLPLRDRLRGQAVAIVDDVVNAGSAVRATHADLLTCGARPVVIGALLVLGDALAPFAAAQHLAVTSLVQRSSGLWLPADCPLCAAGVPLEAPL